MKPPFSAGLIVLVALTTSLFAIPPVRAETPIGSRVYVETAFPPTQAEIVAARRWGKALFAQAKAAGRPVTLRVARSDSTVMISFESVAVCDRVKACPLLVFRDLKTRPVYQGNAFENLRLDYRKEGTWLILRQWDERTECQISGVSRARCRPARDDEE